MSSNPPPDISHSDERSPLLGFHSMEKSDMNESLEKQEPANEEKKGITKDKLLVVICILLCELCERLTYYSCVANLVLYCTSRLEMLSSSATTVSLIFSGTVFIIPVIGGFVADAIAGKYNTILGSGLIYLLGLFLLPASAIDYSKWFPTDDEGASYDMNVETRRYFFFFGLVFIAIGTGGIKANVGPFGAQQVSNLGPDAVQSFFNWFYWFINAGALVAYSAVAYIQQNISFEIGFLIPLISMFVSLIIFVAAKGHYVITEPGGSIIQDTVGVCCNTGCKGFDRARKTHGGRYNNEMVDGVISVLRILPVFLLIILYWAIYSQMQSSFFLQSERLSVNVGDVKMPAAMLNIFNTIIILVLIPIMDRIVYPLLAKHNRAPSHLQRIGVGFILATMSVVVAGILEIYRKKNLAADGGFQQDLAGDTFNASHISVFAQIPEFALVGASEVFTSISGLEFAYSQAPDFMQGVCMGLFLMMSGLGNYVSEAILKIVRAATGTEPPDSWFPEEINEGKLEYLFFLLGIVMFVDFVIFIFVAKCYKYKKIQTEETYEPVTIAAVGEKQEPPGYHNLGYSDENFQTKL